MCIRKEPQSPESGPLVGVTHFVRVYPMLFYLIVFAILSVTDEPQGCGKGGDDNPHFIECSQVYYLGMAKPAMRSCIRR
jgi:hypothetical protein